MATGPNCIELHNARCSRRLGIVDISDPNDERLADYRNVPDAELLAHRHAFVAEGRLVVRRLIAARRLAVRSVMVTSAAHASIHDVTDTLEVPVFVVPQAVMDCVTGFNIHRGCLAIGDRPPSTEWRTLVTTAQRLVVVEGVGNADNMGSIFRGAAAFGVDAVLLGPGCVDPLYRKAIRTSMAASLSIPFSTVAPWPEMIRELDGLGIATIGLTPSTRCTLRDVRAELRDRRTAIVVGHEGEGLTPAALAACSHLARIPIAEDVDSLNVATAATIALYELSTIRGSEW